MPARTRSSEDLPLPLGPTTAVMAPRGNAAVTPRSAVTWPLPVGKIRTTSSQSATGGSPRNLDHLIEVRRPGVPVDDPCADPGHDADGGRGHDDRA